MYELAGVTLLVVEPDEPLRSELVLDLFLHGAEVLVAAEIDEALAALTALRIDCVLVAPRLASRLRRRAREAPLRAAPPIVAMTPPTAPSARA